MTQIQRKSRSTVAFSAAASEAPPRTVAAHVIWGALPGGVIDGGEIVILAIKPSMWKPVFDSASWLVTGSLLAAVLTWFGTPIPGLSITTTAQLVLLVSLSRLGLAVIRWVPIWHVLTNRRVIDVCGVRAPEVSACALLSIRNTYLRCSPAEKIAGLGTITFVTDQKTDAPRLWEAIAKPDEVHGKIRRAIENAIDQCGPVV